MLLALLIRPRARERWHIQCMTSCTSAAGTPRHCTLAGYQSRGPQEARTAQHGWASPQLAQTSSERDLTGHCRSTALNHTAAHVQLGHRHGHEQRCRAQWPPSEALLSPSARPLAAAASGSAAPAPPPFAAGAVVGGRRSGPSKYCDQRNTRPQRARHSAAASGAASGPRSSSCAATQSPWRSASAGMPPPARQALLVERRAGSRLLYNRRVRVGSVLA